jgi:membrane-bound serine protease (ClpP class)
MSVAAAAMSVTEIAAHLAPDAAVLLLALGLLLVCVEINRPGLVLPGALGLLLVLFSVASLLRYDLSRAALALLGTALALLLLDLLRPTPLLVAVAAMLALVFGLDRLVVGPAPQRVDAAVAVLCGLLLGGGTSWLTRIARRARANKALD